MAQQLFKNNAGATLSGTIPIGATSINLSAGQGARFPAPTAGDYFLLTIYEKDVGGVEFNYEVVKCTSRTADTLTVTRDFEGLVVGAGGTSGGWAYPSAIGLNPSQVVYLDVRYTAYACGNTLAKDDNLASVASAATARINLGLGNVENKTFAVGTADATHAATSKTTPVDADEIPMADSAASWGLKKLTWANIKATLLSWLQSTVFPAPGPIGGTTPSSGAFSTLVSGSDASLAGAFGDVAVSQSIVTGGAAQFAGYRFSANTGGANLYLYKSRGASVGINTIVQSGDILGSLNFAGADGVTYHRAAIIAAEVDGTPGVNDMPGRWVFSTTADGASSPTERMRIDSLGNVGIGTVPGYRLHVTNAADGIMARFQRTGGTNLPILQYSFTEATNIIETEATGASAPTMTWKLGGAVRMRLDASGCLVIGKNASVPVLGVDAGLQNWAAQGYFATGRFSADSFSAWTIFTKSRNATIGAHTIVQSGDELGNIAFTGSDGTNFVQAARIRAEVDGTPGTNDMPGRLVFSTVADGASSPTEALRINSSQAVLATGLGGLGYGVGSGGTVTQATSKSTAVTLNKPTGLITTASDALASGASVVFLLNNSLVAATDSATVTVVNNGNYSIENHAAVTGGLYFRLTNKTAGSLSEAVGVHYKILKGSNS